jgi:hypothetical protein
MLIRRRRSLRPAAPQRNFGMLLAAMAMLTAGDGMGAARGVTHPAKTRPGSIHFYHGHDGPRARLRNGREYRLAPLSDTEKQHAIEKAKRARERKAHVQSSSSTPDYVDNRRFHGPIRDQGQRGTCASFATAAALEGAYRRVDASGYRNLVLSPQYINHIQKMVERSPTNQAGLMEDELGCWAGSRIQYLSAVVYRYGACQEATLPYNPTDAYEKNGSDLLDNDGNPLPNAPQLRADDFNLDLDNLPGSALDDATYRPGKVYWITDTQMSDPSYIEQVVASGYDIAFGLTLVDQELTADGAWTPIAGGQIQGGHAMLIIGYNRPQRYFIVRNQWGPDTDAGDGGYTHISYDYLEQYAQEGAVLTEPVDPRQTSTERDWLAWWDYSDNSHLDLYRLPDTYSQQDPRTHDYRVGTWFDPNGKPYRVNGVFDGANLVIYINTDKPNFPPDELSGDWYKMQLNADLQGFKTIDSGTVANPTPGSGSSTPGQDARDCGRC